MNSGKTATLQHCRGAYRAIWPLTKGRALRALALTGTVALLAGGGVVAAQAAPGDTSHAEGRFLSGSLLELMNLDAVVGIDGETASSDGITAETNSQNLGLGILGLVSVDIGGGVQLPVDFANAGVVGQYASAATDASSIGASGLISDAGAIGTGATPAPGIAPGPLSFDLENLLGAEFAGAIADLDLTLGAISAQASVANAGVPVGDYEIASATLAFESPIVSGITGTVNGAVAELDTAVDALAGPTGSLANGVLAAVGSVLAVGGLGDAIVTVDVDLPAAVAPILTTPLDAGGGVIIDLVAGTVTVDLEHLVVGGLNGLPPSTELLSATVLTAIMTEVADLVDQLVVDLESAIATALDNAAVSVDVDVNALGLVPLVNVTVDGTLAQIADGTATVGITALGLLPITGLTSAVVLGVLGPIVNGVIDPVTGSLGTFTSTLVDDVVNPVIDTLNPAIELVNTVVSLLANVQEPSPPVQGAVFTETALRLSLLPTAVVPGLLELNLAHASVGPNALAPLPPALIALTPDEGPTAGGTLVTITGTDLGDASEVTIDGDSVPFTQVSDTEITFVTPPHPAGPVDVTVTTPGGVSNALPFTFVPAPALTVLAHDEGPETGGTTVTITGTDLGGATSVTIDGVSVPFTQVSPTEITFVTPPLAAGPVNVVVTTPGGTSGPLTFTYTPVTTIDGITPPSGPEAGGTEVTSSGHCFTGATQVFFGKVPARSFEVVDDSTIVAVAPAGTGVVDVTVIGSDVCGDATLPDAFTYLAPGAAAAPGAIASTGVDLGGAAGIAGGILLLAALALLIARRRRSA